MPVSGLVITFDRDAIEFEESLRQLREQPCIELGACQGPRLAVVVDSDSRTNDEVIWRWVHELPGVAMVDVAFIGLD